MTSTIAGLKIPSAELCHVQWRSLAWVLENGPLNETNVMEYFSLSPFYDRRSINQVLKMQSMFSGQARLDPKSEKEALKKLVGIEYSLVISKPEDDREGGLFVIEKRQRKNSEEAYPISSYYILKTCIYQSPSFHSVLSCRLLTSLSSLSDLLELARSHKPVYDPEKGYAWKIKSNHQGFQAGSDQNETQDSSQSELTAYEAQPISPTQPRRSSDHLKMTIDPLQPNRSKITPTSIRNPSDLDQVVEVRNIPLERAFQNSMMIFNQPNSNLITQPDLMITEMNPSFNSQDELTNSQLDSNLIHSNSTLNFSSSTHHTQPQDSLMDDSLSERKTSVSVKRKLKRLS
ncbi:MED6 mediator sub complex component-domain-containing protein [Melampsora americana]|nr:MED6 mediator sub complex component-domain-containing protein [Melampsora americana]